MATRKEIRALQVQLKAIRTEHDNVRSRLYNLEYKLKDLQEPSFFETSMIGLEWEIQDDMKSVKCRVNRFHPAHREFSRYWGLSRRDQKTIYGTDIHSVSASTKSFEPDHIQIEFKSVPKLLEAITKKMIRVINHDVLLIFSCKVLEANTTEWNPQAGDPLYAGPKRRKRK